jgi:hypothetical protein
LGLAKEVYDEASEDSHPVLPVPPVELSFWERVAPPVPLVAAVMFLAVPVTAVSAVSLALRKNPVEMVTAKINDVFFSK